ncbi:MAG: hypothetical protein NW226_22805 [Microscillaceae bacterium]|nr:hypothetical protein [Microscillaceae bacterium]
MIFLIVCVSSVWNLNAQNLVAISQLNAPQRLIQSNPFQFQDAGGFSQNIGKTSGSDLKTLQVKELSDSYISIYLLGGVQPISTDGSNMSLSYIDESPSQDNLSVTKIIEEGNSGLGANLGVEFGNYKGWHGELSLSAAFGKADRLGIDVGGGYNFSIGKRFVLRPVLGFSFGSAMFNMGDLNNNDLFIQINDTQFYDENVSVQLRAREYGLRPRADMLFRISNKINIRAYAAYFLGLGQGTPFLRFSGSNDGSGESTTLVEKENITESNVTFSIGDQQTTKLPIDFDGFQFGLGLSFNLGK